MRTKFNRRGFLKSAAAVIGTTAIGVSPLSASKVNTKDTKLHVPSEDVPHEHTFMQWPVSKQVHRDPIFLDFLQKTIADIADTIAQYEPVLVCAPRALHAQARKHLPSKDVYLLRIDTEDLWCRDSGPLIALDEKGRKVISHIQFNGWGGKQAHKNDANIVQEIAEELSLKVVPSGLVGEAGGVEHDGHGLLMAHESSWVNQNRNPGRSRDEIEAKLLKAYGAKKMIWAPGLAGEDITDYHIDSLARFTGKGRILMNLPEKPDPGDVFHQAAIKTHDILKREGLLLDIIHEPNVRRVQSEDFVASYVNYYVCNGALIAPEFGDKEKDAEALEALKRHYPGREIIQINVDALKK